jgi:UDPglucose 6-dehydrogenase
MRSMTKKAKISITGVGMVGGALKSYLEKREDLELFFYDKGKNLGSIEEINKGDVVFVCVPTPYKEELGGFDLSYVQDTCKKLEGEKTVVIKSTVLPGTTEALQKEFPHHRFLFNPEFLVEAKAEETMEKPDRQIMGYTKESKNLAEEVMNLLPDAPYKKIMPATEAEMVKYFGNTFLATKVIFGTQMHEVCEKLGIDYDTVREAASKDPRIGPSHLDVTHGGYMGYGGKCLPKDTRALIQLSEKIKVDIDLLKKTEEINNKLMKEQGIDDPEKYSERNPY